MPGSATLSSNDDYGEVSEKEFLVVLNKVLHLVVNAKSNFTLIKMEAKRSLCHYTAELINDFYA
jgi:hypothetical protein